MTFQHLNMLFNSAWQGSFSSGAVCFPYLSLAEKLICEVRRVKVNTDTAPKQLEHIAAGDVCKDTCRFAALLLECHMLCSSTFGGWISAQFHLCGALPHWCVGRWEHQRYTVWVASKGTCMGKGWKRLGLSCLVAEFILSLYGSGLLVYHKLKTSFP